MMNRGLEINLFTLICLVAVCAFTLVSGAEEVDESVNVAVVNGTPISQEEFDREMIAVEEVIEASGSVMSDAEMAAIKEKVLEKIIVYELLYQECQKEGVEVTETEINERLNKEKSQFTGDAEFQQRLAELGKDEELYKHQIRRELAIQHFINRKFKPTVTDGEARDFYNSNPDEYRERETQVKASHILISVDPVAAQSRKAAARKQIEDLLDRVKNGEDFAALAKQYSDCPSGARGGDLGFFSEGQMVKPFEKAAFAMEPGETSDIVETQFGYHIIKLTDKIGPVTFDDAKDDIKRTLRRQKIADSYNRFYAEVREKADVDIFLNN
jgi:peptidyl-prolyl cis-trans isomerase C